MKKSQLRKIIKEEIDNMVQAEDGKSENALKEMGDDPAVHSSADQLLTVLQDMGYTDPNNM